MKMSRASSVMKSVTIQLVVVVIMIINVCHAVLNCPTLPPHTPANISDLAPGDIKVVIALGDSITAGFGMMGRSGYLDEFRGQSWSIGGDENATTMANFLKHYNPNIIGQSLGQHFVELCYGPICPGKYHPAQDVLDTAQSGAMIEDLVKHEMSYLMDQLTGNPSINIQEDWKLITLLIGANDLCASCTLFKPYLDPDEYEAHLDALLSEIRSQIPRTLVSIVEMFNISQVYNLSLKTPYCVDVHRDIFIECDCLFKKENEDVRTTVDVTAQAYNERNRKIAAYYQSLADPQFTVVIQPFGRDTRLVDQPTNLLSDLDCFHPSIVGHQGMAIALWNNMLTPAAQKKTFLDLNDTPLCPDANTRIFTN